MTRRRRPAKFNRYASCARENTPHYGATKCAKIAPTQRVQTCVTQHDKAGRTIAGPDDVCAILDEAKDADRESFYVVYMNAVNQVNGVEEAHKGTLSHVEVHPREVFKGALAANASAIILAHNHPSGDPTPSEPDLALTKRLVDAGKLLGVPVLDHVVIGRNGCTSIRQRRSTLFAGVRRVEEEQ